MLSSPAEQLAAPASERIALRGGELLFYPHVFADCASVWFDALYEQVVWQQLQLKLFGRQVPLPRLLAWYGEPGAVYAYSGIRHEPLPWLPPLRAMRTQVEALLSVSFNSALLSLYRDGRDNIGWHSDDEPELGAQPCIASLSLGAARRFELRPKGGTGARRALQLPPGSLLLMTGNLQRCWQHRVPRRCGVTGPRINVTFRRILKEQNLRPARRKPRSAPHGR